MLQQIGLSMDTKTEEKNNALEQDGTISLLDGLDEGVIILNDQTGIVSFANQSA